MSGKANKVLIIAIAVSALAVPLTSIHANAMEVRINQVSSNASNDSGGLGGKLIGSLIDKVLQTIRDQQDKQNRNREPIR